MRLAEHFISFSQQAYKFNNTRARILDSIYHMILKIFLKFHFCLKNVIILSFYTNVAMDIITFPKNW